MNLIKFILASLIAITAINPVIAQNIDDHQMDREIEIMEGILDQLFFQVGDNHSMTKGVSGNYLQGFGLVFKIPRYKNYFLTQGVSNDLLAVLSDDNSRLVMGENIFTKDKIDSVQEAGNTYFKETIKSFFVDYGDLISQLEGSDNILVVFGFDSDRENWINNPFIKRMLKNERVLEQEPPMKITAQVSYNDILAYKSGKTNENQFIRNIKLSEEPLSQAVSQEYNILKGIFANLYGRHGNSLSHDHTISFERVEGLGIIYEMSLKHALFSKTRASSFAISSGEREGTGGRAQARAYAIPDQKKMEEYKEQRQKNYGELKLKLKQDLIRYGKTLKSLGDEEILMLATKLSDCLSCNQPDKLNLIVKASVLKDYDRRKITLDEAVEKITEKEVRSESKW